MKKLVLSFTLIALSGVLLETNAQQQAKNNKEFNIYYLQDLPKTGVVEQDKKIEALDLTFKAYEKAINKKDNLKAQSLKTEINNWITENNSWISNLDIPMKNLIDNWLTNSNKSLRLYDEVK